MIQDTIEKTLSLLARSIELLSNEEYSQLLSVLSGASIGQHVRHVIELFTCLEEGMSTGIICYDNRKRNKDLEVSTRSATDQIDLIIRTIRIDDTALVLIADFGTEKEDYNKIQSTYFRELVYNLEHAIHHMALIRIAISAVSDIQLHQSFGVAPSTIRYLQAIETDYK